MEWNNELELGIGCLLYILYIVGLNWSYIKEYMNKGVIKRGIKESDTKNKKEPG